MWSHTRFCRVIFNANSEAHLVDRFCGRGGCGIICVPNKCGRWFVMFLRRLCTIYILLKVQTTNAVSARSRFSAWAPIRSSVGNFIFHITFWLMLNGRGVREARNSIRGPCAFAELVVPNLRLSSNCHFQDCKKRNRMGLVCGKQAAAAAAAKKKNKQISVAFTHVADYRNLQRLIMYISNWTSRDRKWSAQLSSWM